MNLIEEMKARNNPPKYPFEDFLQSMHAKDYHGTDDDMTDDYENWLTNLEIDDVISYGNQALNMALDINKKHD